jgi:UDP-N-acetylmuramate: L-alanyl-gamma-D-glutamyl-meso-diaminopimelate ligase
MKKWIHIIGIAGVVTSAIAVMYKQKGWKVTGSDKGFFPPVTDYLAKHNIDILRGFDANRLNKQGVYPDLIVVQSVIGTNNIEYSFALENKLNIKTFPEIIADEVIVDDNSIIVVGTYGKTSTTAILQKIFEQANIEVSYMYGAFNTNLDENIKSKSSSTKYSIVEGDEYIESLENRKSKFFRYKPKYLLINGISWEHPDVFPTEQSYVDNFVNLIKTMPSDGIIFANACDKNTVSITQNAHCKVIYFATHIDQAFCQYNWYLNYDSKPLPTLVSNHEISDKFEIIPFERNIIGQFNDYNFLAASVVSYELGIRKERIQEALANFGGIKRRLETRFKNSKLQIIDDFGSSPPKAMASLVSIRQSFPNYHIITIFEPNTGNRTPESVDLYKNVFDKSNEIIFPRFTKLPKTNIERYDSSQLAEKLKKYYPDIKLIDNDQELITYITTKIQFIDKKFVILFLGSHGFRGMINKLIETVSNS